MRTYELIVFDWDGTIFDSILRIIQAIQAACADLGLARPDDERARHVIGLGLEEALQYAAPDLTPEGYPEMVARYRHHYLQNPEGLVLFDGITELITDLTQRGCLLAVATGKSRAGLRDAFSQTGLGKRFVSSRCADECHSKPHPQMLLELLEELEVAADKAVMIGDTTHDIQMANNAGVDAVAVTYGAHNQAQLLTAQPLFFANSVVELGQWLTKHTSRST